MLYRRPVDLELLVPNVRAEVMPEAIPMIGDDRIGIPQERIEYWHSMQKFVGERRRNMKDDVPEAVRTELLKEWSDRQMKIAKDIKARIDNGIRTDEVRKRLRSSDGTPAIPIARAEPAHTIKQPVHNPIDPHMQCKKCNSQTDAANMLICDACEKGFHKRCIGMTRMPAKNHGWLCHACLQPGMRISKFWTSDKAWHDGTVTMQHADESLGTDVQYDDGTREHTNLNQAR